MPENLGDKTYRAAFWGAVDAFGSRLGQFIVGVVLARLLLPEQFGLLGMLAVFMAVSQAFLDSGFGVALIRKKEMSQADTSSVFYFNVVIGAALAGLLCLLAPWIASFYGQPILVSLTRAMSLLLVVNSFGVVQTAMLTRNIDFKTQAKIGLASMVFSGAIGVGMAYGGYGVWSLVGQQLSRAVCFVGLLWTCNRWRPGLIFSFTSLRHMFSFGSRMLASSLLNQIIGNIYTVLIGKVFSAADLGHYTRANRLQELPSTTLTSIVTRVSLPVFSRIQDDNTRLRSALRRALSLLMFLNAPVMMLLGATAPALVAVLLTAKWLPCVGYLELLCIQGLLLPLHSLNLNLLIVKGRSDLFLRLEMIKRLLTLCNVAVSWHWGISAIIIGQILLSVVSYFLNSYYTGKLLGYSAPDQVRDVAAYILLAGLTGLGAFALRYVGIPSAGLLLAAQLVAGGTSYLLLCRFLRLPAFAEACGLVAAKVPSVARFIRLKGASYG